MASPIITIAIVIGICYLLRNLLRSLLKYGYDVMKMRNIVGPVQIPFIGNAHLLEYGGPEFYNQILYFANLHQHVPMFRIWIGIYPVIILHHHKAVEAVLNGTRHITKAFQYNFLHNWLGTGLLTSTGSKWHSRRKLLTPAFHFSILQDFCPIFNEQARVLVEMLEQELGERDSCELDIFPFVCRCALDIICETAMGTAVGAQTESNSKYVNAVTQMSELIMRRMKNPIYYSDFLFNRSQLGKESANTLSVLHNFTNSVIAERRQELNELTQAEREELLLAKRRRKRLSFLDLLLVASESAESGEKLNDEGIREEVDTFMFEGHDTTAAAMSWCLFLLGHNQQVLQQVHEEIDSIWEQNRLNEEGNLSSESLSCVPLLDRCVKEALRLYPSVPYYGREAAEDIHIDDYTITAGSSVLIMASQLHRDPKVFPEPNEFKPERFLPEAIRTRNPYSYVPFSAGPRNCIGAKFAQLEERMVLCWLLRHFTVRSLQTEEQLAPSGEVILRPANGVKVQLSRRLV